MAKLKAIFSGDNLKHFFLKHGEKLVLGFVGMFVLISLMGTNWFPYDKKPAELTQKLQTADGVIASAQWPEDEQLKYPVLNVQEDVNQMLAEMPANQFSFSTPYVTSVFGADEPRKEPELLVVMEVKADAGRTVLAQSTDPVLTESSSTELAENKPAENTTNDNDLVADDVASRPVGVSALGADGMSTIPGANPYEEEIAINYDPNQMVLGPSDEMGMEGTMGLPSNVKGVPVRYITVRGVYDLRKQILNYARALNVTETDASRLVEFLDFRLERQVADSASGPWGEWEPVDIEVAIDYLTQTVDFDPDVVSAGVRNPVITMPLPARLMGVWRNKVNHPAVKNFELSDAEMEAEFLFNQKILEDAQKNNQKIKQRRAPGGFNGLQLDMTSIQQDYFEQTDARQLNKAFDGELKGTPDEVKKKLIERIKAQVSAAGNLVLFRYIDFDLMANKSYRYRVSLVLRNPNYDQPIERVVHPSVVEGETRETPMSEPSNVATVTADYAYFLTDVAPPRGVANEQADMQIFQWYDKTGTMIKGNLTIEPGDYISGKTSTYVLDPAEMKYEVDPEVTFRTYDLLVDALVMPKLDPRQHTDLKLPRELTRGSVGVVPQVLVVDYEGNLQEIDPVTKKSTQDSYENYYLAEKKPFEALKDASKKMSEVSELDALLDPEGMMMMEGMENMDGASRLRGRRRNPTRRGGMDSSMMMSP